MARILILSLRASGYEGKIIVITNSHHQIFQIHKNLEKLYINTAGLNASSIAIAAKEQKFKIHSRIDVSKYDQIFYIDSDCLALENPSTRLISEKKISCAVERWAKITAKHYCDYLTEREMAELQMPGLNSGVFRIRASAFTDTLNSWEAIYNTPRIRDGWCLDQPAWVRLVLNEGKQVDYWKSPDTIRYPMVENMHVTDYNRATLLHYCGKQGRDRLNHMAADYLRIFKPQSLFDISDLSAS